MKLFCDTKKAQSYNAASYGMGVGVDGSGTVYVRTIKEDSTILLYLEPGQAELVAAELRMCAKRSAGLKKAAEARAKKRSEKMGRMFAKAMAKRDKAIKVAEKKAVKP